jgi:hemin uptake protein HemP
MSLLVKATRTSPLTAKELYLFDTTGHLKIPGMLDATAVEYCREQVLALPSRIMPGRGDKRRFDDIINSVPALGELARSQHMRQLVTPLINQPYRVIESYALLRGKDSVFYLHNGHSELIRYGSPPSIARNTTYGHSYHDGKLYCNFIKVLLYLSDQRSDADGPFCFLQGSHKANLPWFSEGELDGKKPDLSKENFPSLEQLYTSAGDAVIINEALLHGTLPKTTGGQRLVLAISYAPAFVADWKAIDLMSDDIARLGHY